MDYNVQEIFELRTEIEKLKVQSELATRTERQLVTISERLANLERFKAQAVALLLAAGFLPQAIQIAMQLVQR